MTQTEIQTKERHAKLTLNVYCYDYDDDDDYYYYLTLMMKITLFLEKSDMSLLPQASCQMLLYST